MIQVNLDVVLAKRKMRVIKLTEMIGLSNVSISLLKNGKAKGIRFDTLEKICKALECQPGDILEYCEDKELKESKESKESIEDKEI